MSYHFLLDLALILLSTKILGLVAQKLQMPQVVGALIAGLLLSPAGLGLLSETEFTKQLSELGVIVLMFSAGMGTDINELKHSGKAGFMVAVLGVVVPFLMGTALAWGADELGLIESTGFIENIFIGTILTATSVSITVETLKEMKKLETKVGNTILAAALIDDALGLIALTFVCSLAGGDESIGMVLLKIEGFFVFAFVLCLGWPTVRKNSSALPISRALTPRASPSRARPRVPTSRRSTTPSVIFCLHRFSSRALASTCRSQV